MPVSRPAVSQHLTVLKTAGLVSEHREGTRRIYRLEPDGFDELRRWVDALARDARVGRVAAAPTEATQSTSDPSGDAVAAGATAGDRAGSPKDDRGKKKHGKKRAGRK